MLKLLRKFGSEQRSTFEVSEISVLILEIDGPEAANEGSSKDSISDSVPAEKFEGEKMDEGTVTGLDTVIAEDKTDVEVAEAEEKPIVEEEGMSSSLFCLCLLNVFYCGVVSLLPLLTFQHW